MINIYQPSLGKEEVEAVSEVFTSNWLGYGRNGTKQVEFVKQFANKIVDESFNGGYAMSDPKFFTTISCCSEALFQAVNVYVKEGDEVEVNLTFFDHDKKRLHFKMEMIEKSSQKLSATLEMLSLYIDLNKRKVSEFEGEKIKIMNNFILKNKINFNNKDLKFSTKLKK